MTWLEFIHHVRRQTEHTPAEYRIAQGALGLASEISELHRSNGAEDVELGDVWFYLAQVWDALGLGIANFHLCESLSRSSTDPAVLERSCISMIADLCGIAEKVVFQGHSLMRHYQAAELVQCIGGQLIQYGRIGLDLEPQDIWAANVEKLAKRYPDGFTTADSIARVDEEGS